MKQFEKFSQIIDTAGQRIMSELDNPGLLFSGGIDSTMVALSLYKTGKPFFLIHYENYLTVHTGKDNKWFEHLICEEFSDIFEIPMMFLFPNKENQHLDKYRCIAKQGIKKVVSGNGLDRIYGSFGKGTGGWDATFGEDFRCFHPIIDKILKSIPSRIPFRNDYTGEDNDHERDIENAKPSGVEVIFFSLDTDLIQFFRDYTTNIKDVVFPKMLSVKYIDNALGMSYRKFCCGVYNKNRHRIEPFLKRTFAKLIREGSMKIWKR
jgi:hypothetical protein